MSSVSEVSQLLGVKGGNQSCHSQSNDFLSASVLDAIPSEAAVVFHRGEVHPAVPFAAFRQLAHLHLI